MNKLLQFYSPTVKCYDEPRFGRKYLYSVLFALDWEAGAANKEKIWRK